MVDRSHLYCASVSVGELHSGDIVVLTLPKLATFRLPAQIVSLKGTKSADDQVVKALRIIRVFGYLAKSGIQPR